ncbi:MAG: FecR domain-containing protein [Alphaproteobacteria bacterium]
MGTREWLLLTTALMTGVATGASAQDNSRIGTTKEVNPQARAIRVATQPRVLFVGNELFQNERITTDAKGQVHVLFVDQSALTVGPNSDVMLDKFVFDPAKGTGQAALQMTRGTLRFVGGKLSKTQDVEIKTPTATVGIRGGISIVQQQPNGQFLVVHLFGDKTSIKNADGTITELTRRGFGVMVPGGQPFELSAAQMAALLAALEGGTGRDSTAGKTFVATDDPTRSPRTDIPDWVYSMIGNFGGLGLGDWHGLDLRKLEEILGAANNDLAKHQTFNPVLVPVPPPVCNPYCYD